MSILIDENTQGGCAPLHAGFAGITPRIRVVLCRS